MAKKKFQPVIRYALDKGKSTNGKPIYKLDETGKRIKLNEFKATTFEDMINFLSEYGSKEEVEKFFEMCYKKKVFRVEIGPRGGEKKIPTNEYEKTSEINILLAKEWFFAEFAPEFLPSNNKKEKDKKTTTIELLNQLMSKFSEE